MTTLKIRKLPHGNSLPLPSYANPGDAGLDLYLACEDEISLRPHARILAPTGIQVQIPEGYEGQIRPRSGNAIKHGITVLNSPGTIDSSYRGEVGVILCNSSTVPVEFRRGERIAQLVIAPVTKADVVVVDELDGTERGAGGFGSSGQ